MENAWPLTRHSICQLLTLLIKARQLRHLCVAVHLHAEWVLHYLHVGWAVLLPTLHLLLQVLHAVKHDGYKCCVQQDMIHNGCMSGWQQHNLAASAVTLVNDK